jgi:hypothetical protein
MRPNKALIPKSHETFRVKSCSQTDHDPEKSTDFSGAIMRPNNCLEHGIEST